MCMVVSLVIPPLVCMVPLRARRAEKIRSDCAAEGGLATLRARYGSAEHPPTAGATAVAYTGRCSAEDTADSTVDTELVEFTVGAATSRWSDVETNTTAVQRTCRSEIFGDTSFTQRKRAS